MKNKKSFLSRAIAVLPFVALAHTVQAADRVQDGFLVHDTQPNDTLIGLCQRYCAQPQDWPELMYYNAFVPPWFIPLYRQVFIPLTLLKREPETLEVVSVQGEAYADGAPLAAGARMRSGTRVATGKDGYVTLRLEDGSTLSLQAASEVEIERAERVMGTPIRDIRLVLSTGRIETHVSQKRPPQSQFHIRTPVAKTAVRGTDYRVASDETTRGEVLSGSVAVSNAAASPEPPVMVERGYGTLVKASAPPLPPRPLLPAPDLAGARAVLTRDRTLLSFPPLTGAHAYRVQLASDAEFRQVVAEGVFREARATFGPLPEGVYHYRVRAIDEIGLEGFDAAASLRLERERPAVPMPLDPADGARLSGDRLELRWKGNSPRYRVQVARDAAFLQVVEDRSDVTVPHCVLGLGEQPGDYYWRVAGFSAQGELGAYGRARRFTIQPPPAPVPVAPPDGAEFPNGRLQLRWTGDTPRYHVQLAGNPDFDHPILDRDDVPAGALALELDTRPARYFWRVAGVSAQGLRSAFGPPREFSVRPPPPPVTFHEDTDDEALIFVWQAPAGMRSEFQLAAERDFRLPLLSIATADGRVRVPKPEPGDYYYRIRLVAPDGEAGPYSPPNLVTVTEAPRPWWLLLLLALPFL